MPANVVVFLPKVWKQLFWIHQMVSLTKQLVSQKLLHLSYPVLGRRENVNNFHVTHCIMIFLRILVTSNINANVGCL